MDMALTSLGKLISLICWFHTACPLQQLEGPRRRHRVGVQPHGPTSPRICLSAGLFLCKLTLVAPPQGCWEVSRSKW